MKNAPWSVLLPVLMGVGFVCITGALVVIFGLRVILTRNTQFVGSAE